MGKKKVYKLSVEQCILVHRRDKKLLDALGDKVRGYDVHEWDSPGRGNYARWRPQVYRVPPEDVAATGLTPMSLDEGEALHLKSIRAGRKAHVTAMERQAEKLARYNAKVDKIAYELGLLPGSRLAQDVLAGELDLEDAKRIAEKIIFRHEQTDYDLWLANGMDRDFAREKVEILWILHKRSEAAAVEGER